MFNFDVVMTTLPGRYECLEKTINSILSQNPKPEHIYLALPSESKRLGIKYPELPFSIQKNVVIINCDDYGPLTKLYGSFQITDLERLIISLDDDITLSPDYFKHVLSYAITSPGEVICTTGALLNRKLLFSSIVTSLKPLNILNDITGFNVPRGGRKVDLIFGVGGVCYRRKFLNQEIFQIENLYKSDIDVPKEDLFKNDDLIISSYLSRKNIPRLVIPDCPPVLLSKGASYTLSGDFYKMIGSLNRTFQYLIQTNQFILLDTSINESTLIKSITILIVIIFLILLIIIFLIKI